MINQRVLLNKALVIGILILFIGMSVVSSSRNVVEEVSDNTQLDSFDISEVLSNQNSICYGYCINDPSGQLIEGPISFSLNDLGNISQLWGTSSIAPMVGGAWTWDGWFCCEYGSGKLWKIDYDSGYMMEIGGGGIHLNGLSWSSDDILVGSSNTSLYMVDEETGEQTFICSFGLPEGSKMGGIAFDFIAQRLYGVEYVNNRLYEIDPDNGETEYIGQLGIEINGIAVLDYNVEDDCLYLSTFTDQGELYNVDRDTGECTLVGELQGGAEITALTINPYRIYLPTANFTWFPRYPQSGETIVFNASDSYSEGGNITLYEWDWNYDIIFDETTNNPITEYIFEETGYYPVTLLVHNNYGMDTQQYVVYVGTILYVGGTGEDNYTKIQDAIDDANPGDTVFVYNGTYYENVVINKTINLIGENKNTTVIDGGGNRDVVHVSANYVNTSSFTIQNSGNEAGNHGLSIYSNYCVIKNNIIINNRDGILLRYSSYNIIDNNIVNFNSINGLSLINSCNYNIIKNNNFSKNDVMGIYFVWDSNYNQVLYNIIIGNSKGIFMDISLNCDIIGNNINNNTDGVIIRYSSNILFCHNIVNKSIYQGIELSASSNIKVKNNIISETYFNEYNGNGIGLQKVTNISITQNSIIANVRGLKLIDTSFCFIYQNNISNNTINGIYFWPLNSKNNIIKQNLFLNNYHGIFIHSNNSNNNIFHNNFINNTQNAYDEGSNIWDNGYPSGGNFWDDYNGEDNDGDGIGDTPYPIPGGINKDRYPLGNFPPDKPDIDGPPSGKPGVEYRWVFHSEDPECLSIYYYIDWGDGNITDWFGPYPSCMPVEVCHTYDETGFYVIGAKVKDIYDAESDWTYFDVEIEIPRNRATIYSLFQLFFNRFPFLEVFLRAMNLLR